MSDKIDLDALERRIASDHNARLSRAQSLALIARIRELEAALGEMCTRAHRGAMWDSEIKRFRALVARGTVLP